MLCGNLHRRGLEGEGPASPTLEHRPHFLKSAPMGASTKEFLVNSNTIGVLSDTEVLLVSVIQGKRVLRSILLPPDVSELEGLLEVLWQAELSSVWVMPG